MEPLRIVLYSHDSIGLGHVRRNLALAHALANQLPGIAGRPVTGILVTGTALAPAFTAPACWDWVLLPGMSKTAGRYQPRNLTIPAADLIALRSRLLESVLSGYRPDLVLIDRHPTGIGGELALPLSRLRAAHATAVVLGLREVLDNPQVARSEWASIGGTKTVRDLFDAIWVYGDPTVHDPVASGEIPFSLRKIIRYTGYLASGRPPGSGTSFMTGPYCLTTVGGGSDGYELASKAAAAPLPPGLGHLIVAGPQMPRDRLVELQARAADRARVVSEIPDVVFHMRNAAAVITMGGYNSVCEILSTNVPALVVPRTQARDEQRIRARSLAKAGLIEYREIGSLTPLDLGTWIAERSGERTCRQGVRLDGLARVPLLAAELTALPSTVGRMPAGRTSEEAHHAAV